MRHVETNPQFSFKKHITSLLESKPPSLILYFLIVFVFLSSFVRAESYYFLAEEYGVKNFSSPILNENFCSLVAKSYFANCTASIFDVVASGFLLPILNLFGQTANTSCINQVQTFFFNCSQIYESNLTNYERKLLITRYLINETGPEMRDKITGLNDKFMQTIGNWGIHQKPPPRDVVVFDGQVFKDTWVSILYFNNSVEDENNETWVTGGQAPMIIHNIDFVVTIPDVDDCSPPFLGVVNYDYNIKTYYDGEEGNEVPVRPHGSTVNVTAVLNFSGYYTYYRHHYVQREVCDEEGHCTTEESCESYLVRVSEEGSVSDTKLVRIFSDDLPAAYMFIDRKTQRNISSSSKYVTDGFIFFVSPHLGDCIVSLNNYNITIKNTVSYPGVVDKDPYDFLVHKVITGMNMEEHSPEFSLSYFALKHDSSNNETNETASRLFSQYNVPIGVRNMFNKSKMLSLIQFNLLGDNIVNCSYTCNTFANPNRNDSIDCNYDESRMTKIQIEKRNISNQQMEVKIRLLDVGERGLANKKIEINYGGSRQEAVTDGDGTYTLSVAKGLHEAPLSVAFKTDGIHMSSLNSITIDPLASDEPIIFWLKIFIIFGLLYYCYKQIFYMFRTAI